MQVDDKNIEFDKDGFMLEPDLWDDAVASAIAGEEGISEMSEDHWKIVNFIRSYWKENDLAPPVRLMCKEVGIGLRQIYKLFTASDTK